MTKHTDTHPVEEGQYSYLVSYAFQGGGFGNQTIEGDHRITSKDLKGITELLQEKHGNKTVTILNLILLEGGSHDQAE